MDEDNKCTACEYQRIDFSNIDIYSSDYGYNYLGTLENGEKMQELYLRIESAAKKFHINNETGASFSISCVDLGFKIDETYIQTVLGRFLYDNPLYYWISSFTYSYYTSSKLVVDVIVKIVPEYQDGSVRANYNAIIYDVAEEYYSVVENEESPYIITLAYYDMIIDSIDYAYEIDGTTPEDAKWAHSIIGVFTKQGVVCEGYAKALQMMLNVSGVENIYIAGDAGGGHAWSLIRLDDGRWYWFDSTWDDSGIYDWLAGKNYFAVTNDTVVVVDENGNETKFSQNHAPYVDYAWGWPTLPEISDVEFEDTEIIEVLEIFKVGTDTYQVVGYNKVHLIASSVKSGSYTTKQFVEYNGELYEVVGTGTMYSTGQLIFDSIFAQNSVTEIIFSDGIVNIQGVLRCTSVTSVTISSSVKHISSYAFSSCSRLKTINYEGTIAEWNAISKGSNWNSGCGTITVYCSDGNVKV